MAQDSDGVPATIPRTKGTFTPMTGSDRLKRYLKDTASPLALLRSAASAGIGQWENRPKEWKQGSRGYGLRYGSSFAEHIVNTTLASSVAAALGEDNRYLRSGESGFGARSEYALESTFLARRNDGTRRLSVSRIVGFAGAALISRLWQPRSTRGLRYAGFNFGTEIGAAAGFNFAREFLGK